MNLLDYSKNAMYGQFYLGLKPKIQNTLSTTGLPQTFAALYNKAVKIDQVSFSIERATKQSTSSSIKFLEFTPLSGSTPVPSIISF